MALQSSGEICLDDIVAEFGGTAPHCLNEYYAGGGLVPSGAGGSIPASGQICLDDFYGSTSVTVQSGSFWSWGSTGFNGKNVGQNLGNNETSAFGYSSPVQVAGGGTDWVADFSAEVQPLSQTFALNADGDIYTWGNEASPLGINNTSAISSPTLQVDTNKSGGWYDAAYGYSVATATRSDGRLWSVGNDYNGAFGNGNNVNTRGGSYGYCSTWEETSFNDTSWQVSYKGAVGNMEGIRTDGRYYTWGNNAHDNRQSAQGSTGPGAAFSTPMQTTRTGTDWKIICNKNAFPAAVTTNGYGLIWGQDGGSTGNFVFPQGIASTPVQIQGSGWVSCSAGYYRNWLKSDGRLWRTGNGFASYTMGAGGPTGNPTSPEEVAGNSTLWSTTARGKMYGASNMMGQAALRTDGKYWHWGSIYNGQSGNSTNAYEASTPINAPSGTSWIDCRTHDRYHTGIKN